MTHLSVAFESAKTPAEVKATSAGICQLIKDKKLKIADLSIRDIAVSTLGMEAVMKMGESSEGGFSQDSVGFESVAPVNTQAFLDITGNLIYEAGIEGYRSPDFIGDRLVTAESASIDGGRDIGLSAIDDEAMVVKEGEEFPDTNFGQDYIDIPLSEKRGLKIGLTKEAIFFDRTGKIVENAMTIGYRLGLSKEKRTLRTVLGITNNYSRRGVARNTYVATGGGDPRINLKAATPLTDWTGLDAMVQLFADMSDDRLVPEPVKVEPKQLLLPGQLTVTAQRIMNATEVRTVTNTAITTIGGNPISKMEIITSPWIVWLLVEAGVDPTVAKNRWYAGDFKRAFKYRTLFPYEMRSAVPNGPADFERDVLAQFRCSERGTPRIVAPWHVAEFNAA